MSSDFPIHFSRYLQILKLAMPEEAKKPMKTIMSRAATAIFFLVLLCGRSAAAVEPSEVVILYGGFGHLANSAQPVFGQILTNPAVRKERAVLERKIIKAIRAEKFGLSDYGVITTNEGFRKALDQKAGERLRRINLKKITTYFSKAYMLVLTGTFEFHVPVYSKNDYAQKRDEHFNVGVSAMLVEHSGDLGEARIVLSATATTEITLCSLNLCDLPQFVSATERRKYFGMAYATAGVAAVKRLAARLRRLDGKDIKDFVDRAMVTGVYVDQPKARRLFGVKEPAAKPRSCRVSSRCANPALCNPLIGFIANAATAALGVRGHMVLPPLRWAQWGYQGAERSAVTMALSRGLRVTEGTLNINVSDNSADLKVTAIFGGIDHEDREFEDTDKLRHRYHTAVLKLCAYETEPLNANRITKVRFGISYSNEKNSPVHELVVVGDPATQPDVLRGFSLIAIRNAFGGM